MFGSYLLSQRGLILRRQRFWEQCIIRGPARERWAWTSEWRVLIGPDSGRMLWWISDWCLWSRCRRTVVQGLGTLNVGIVAARVSRRTTGKAVSSPYFLPRWSCVLARVILLSFASPRVHFLASWPGQGHLKIWWWSKVIVVWRVVYSDSFSYRCALMMGADDQGRNRGTYPCIHSGHPRETLEIQHHYESRGYKGLGWQILLHVVLNLKGWYSSILTVVAWDFVNVEGLLLCEAWARTKRKGINRLSSGGKIGQTFAWLPPYTKRVFLFSFYFFVCKRRAPPFRPFSSGPLFYHLVLFFYWVYLRESQGDNICKLWRKSIFSICLHNISLHLAP